MSAPQALQPGGVALGLVNGRAYVYAHQGTQIGVCMDELCESLVQRVMTATDGLHAAAEVIEWLTCVPRCWAFALSNGSVSAQSVTMIDGKSSLESMHIDQLRERFKPDGEILVLQLASLARQHFPAWADNTDLAELDRTPGNWVQSHGETAEA